MRTPDATAVDPGLNQENRSSLLTDLYQLTMLQGYFAERMEETAVFEFFVRRIPSSRNFLMAAGLEQVLEFLESFCFTPSDVEWLGTTGLFRPDFLDYLAKLRFSGDVHAMPEGTIFFPGEPVVRITAPLPQAQIVETRVINLLHFQTLIASKAARCVLAAAGRKLVDFGLRRAHGAEAGLTAARAAFLAGFDATSNVLAGLQFGIPISGTMAHSYVQAHDSEESAFLEFSRANPASITFLLDTYDTEAAAEKTVFLWRYLQEKGLALKAVRLDSGDLVDHARKVRCILDRGGLADVSIFASGNLDEYEVKRLVASDAPIDGFGIGTRLNVSADAPYLDCAYKIQEYAGRPLRKRSEGKSTLPGRKQVWRKHGQNTVFESDWVGLMHEASCGAPLLLPHMQNGRRNSTSVPLLESRKHAQKQLAQLPDHLRSLEHSEPFPVGISPALTALANDVDRRLS